MSSLTISSLIRRMTWWQWAWLAGACASLPPLSYYAYQDVQNTGRELRVQLIQRYSLWETEPSYRGTPQSWTRFAAMLLNNGQLMRRIRQKHGDLAEQIEVDFNRDAALAYAKVLAPYVLGWAGALAMLYGMGWAVSRRRRTTHQRAQ